jgi:hypothetical protein
MKCLLFSAVFAGAMTSVSALAAIEISRTDAAQHQKMGSVSATTLYGGPEKLNKELKEKAQHAGAGYYVITSFDQSEGGQRRATATLYR